MRLEVPGKYLTLRKLQLKEEYILPSLSTPLLVLQKQTCRKVLNYFRGNRTPDRTIEQIESDDCHNVFSPKVFSSYVVILICTFC